MKSPDIKKAAPIVLGTTLLAGVGCELIANSQPDATSDNTVRYVDMGPLKQVPSNPNIVFPPRLGVRDSFPAPADIADRLAQARATKTPTATGTPVPADLALPSSNLDLAKLEMTKDEMAARNIDPHDGTHDLAGCLRPFFMAEAPDQTLASKVVDFVTGVKPAEAAPEYKTASEVVECLANQPLITDFTRDYRGVDLKNMTEENVKGEIAFKDLPQFVSNFPESHMTLAQAQAIFRSGINMTFKVVEKDKDGNDKEVVRMGGATMLDDKDEVARRRAAGEKMIFWTGEQYEVVVKDGQVVVFRQDCANELVWAIPSAPKEQAPAPTNTPVPATSTSTETSVPATATKTSVPATNTPWPSTNAPTPTPAPAANIPPVAPPAPAPTPVPTAAPAKPIPVAPPAPPTEVPTVPVVPTIPPQPAQPTPDHIRPTQTARPVAPEAGTPSVYMSPTIFAQPAQPTPDRVRPVQTARPVAPVQGTPEGVYVDPNPPKPGIPMPPSAPVAPAARPASAPSNPDTHPSTSGGAMNPDKPVSAPAVPAAKPAAPVAPAAPMAPAAPARH